MNTPLRWWAFLGFLAAAASASALEWSRTEVEISGRAGQNVLTASFPFRNASSKPVAITSVVPGCDCTTATVSGRNYQPNESGVVLVEFAVGERRGAQTASITVTADDSGTPTILWLRIRLPEPVSLESRRLVWQAGEAATENVVRITAAAAADVTLEPPRTSDARFRAALETVEAGREWRLRVSPVQTEVPAQGVILIEFSADGRRGIERVLAVVRPPDSRP